jgi:trehalose synthase
MARPKFVQIPSHQLSRFQPLLGDAFAEVEQGAAAARERFRGRAIWHVSSTLRGGGVAEMLGSLLPYVRGAGIDARWVVLRERAEFFALTKRLHNNLHGEDGGGDLGATERALYEKTLHKTGKRIARLLQPGDVVFLHDPQTAGLAPAARAAGATVLWRCHIGVDEPNETALAAQRFLLPDVREANVRVFSRAAYRWPALEDAPAWTMAPSIDPFSPKNQELEGDAVAAILGAIGLCRRVPERAPRFSRADGTPGRVERAATILQEEPLRDGEFVVAQVSRWDRLKDHRGLLECFASELADADLHLVLAGPDTEAVADDPEGAAVWEGVCAAWRELPAERRCRSHLLSLPMADLEENAAMVNALQRRADVVVQKSIAEGFGLTVAEAMWKRRAVIASRVGGIQDQIVDGASGLLVEPRDLAALAARIRALQAEPQRAAALGEGAHRRVRERFLGISRLLDYGERLAALEEESVR